MVGVVGNSKSQFDPHESTDQSGASRSVSPATERRASRLCEERKRGSDVRSWYLSAKIGDGSVR